jgi:hypothetical protein
MKNRLKYAANIFTTFFLIASLSGCVSVLDYWSDESVASEASAPEEPVPEGKEATSAENVIPDDPPPDSGTEVPAAGLTGEPDAAQEKAAEAEAARQKTEAELAAANKRVAELEAAQKSAAGANVSAVAAAQEKAAEAEAARQKTEAELAAANKRVAELEAAQKSAEVPAPGAAVGVELAAAQKQAAEAEAARKKAEADAEAAQKKAAADLAATQKKAADAEAAQKKAEADAEAAQKKADADLAAAQEKAAEAEVAQKKAEADAEAAQKKAAEAEAAQKKAEAEAAAATVRKKAEAEAVAADEKKAEAEAVAAAVYAVIQQKADELFLQARDRGQIPQTSPAGQQPGMINANLTLPGAVQNAAGQDGQGRAAGVAPETPGAIFPKYYTVGTWPPDCFWEIARLVYGDPYRWPVLYEVNRSKLEDPENPDSLATGTVLEIPSINGESREGYYTR